MTSSTTSSLTQGNQDLCDLQYMVWSLQNEVQEEGHDGSCLPSHSQSCKRCVSPFHQKEVYQKMHVQQSCWKRIWMNIVCKSFKTKLSSKYLGSLQSCPSYFALTTLQINSLLHSGSYIASSSRKSIWCSQSFQTSLPWCTQRGWKSNSLFVWDKTEKDMKNNIGPTCQPSMFGNNHVQQTCLETIVFSVAGSPS